MMANDYDEDIIYQMIGTIAKDYVRSENEQRRKYFMDQKKREVANETIRERLEEFLRKPGFIFTTGSWSQFSDPNKFELNLSGYYADPSLGHEPYSSVVFNHIPRLIEPTFMIKSVMFNDPATIVFWDDGTKTVVKCENEEFDKEKGLAMAFMKKMLGNKGRYFNEVKKWTRQETDTQPDT